MRTPPVSASGELAVIVVMEARAESVSTTEVTSGSWQVKHAGRGLSDAAKVVNALPRRGSISMAGLFDQSQWF